MKRYKQISLFLFAAAALAIAFYFGRITGGGNGDATPGHEEEEHSEESHEEHETLITLDPQAQARFNIRTEQPQRRAIGKYIEATGSVQVNETRLVHVRPLARGRIHEVHVRLGDSVQAGQPLLMYDNIELGEALGQYVAALADVQKSNSETGIAKRALDRARSLVTLGAVARAELLKREAEYQNAMSETESRKAKAAQIEEKLHRFGMTDPEIRKITPDTDADYHREASHSVLRSPLNGVITKFSAAPGENIDPEDELMTISDLAIVWVQADVYEKDIRFVREGSAAQVRVGAHPDRVFPGTITYVGDVLDPQTRTAKVRVEVDNPGRLLKVEMFTNVRIPMPETRVALMVPSEAVHRIEEETVTFVKKGNQFERRPVIVGERSGDWIEVTEGISEEESVVTAGSFLLKSEAMKSELGGHEH